MLDGFDKKYFAYEHIRQAFNDAEADGDKEGMENAQDAYQAFEVEVSMEGKDFEMLYFAYQKARDNGNMNIHLSNGDAAKAERLVECMRRNGVHYFTYHGSMANAMEFEKAGSYPVGFRMVRGEENCFTDNGYDEIPSVLMAVE